MISPERVEGNEGDPSSTREAADPLLGGEPFVLAQMRERRGYVIRAQPFQVSYADLLIKFDAATITAAPDHFAKCNELSDANKHVLAQRRCITRSEFCAGK